MPLPAAGIMRRIAGAKSGQRAFGHCRCRPVSGRAKRGAQSPDNHAAYLTGIAKPHFGFCRMHIHIKLGGRHINKQRQCRMPITGEKILISTAHRAIEQTAFNRTAIDHQILFLRCCVIESRQSGKTVKPHPVALSRHGDRIIAKIAPHNGRQPRQLGVCSGIGQCLFGGIGKAAPPIGGQGKADFGMRHCQSFQHIAHRGGFGAVGFQKFQPRRCRIK